MHGATVKKEAIFCNLCILNYPPDHRQYEGGTDDNYTRLKGKVVLQR